MEYRKLGNSGLKVSVIGLGGNSFGWKIDKQASARIIDYAIDNGINFIDTADMYCDGDSERFIGSALKGKRSKIIVATKFGSFGDKDPNENGSSRRHVIQALEASLKRLQTDYVDLFQMHDPDPDTPIEETLRALDDLVKAGKILYIGCCDFATWQLCDALWTSRVNNLAPFVTTQVRYNLLDRHIETELAGFCQITGIGIIPWGPLAGGFLTGKYGTNEKKMAISIRNAKSSLIKAIYGDIPNEANWNLVSRLTEFATSRGHSVGELALAWLLSKSLVSAVCPSATSQEQLSVNLNARKWVLSPEEIAEVESMAPVNR